MASNWKKSLLAAGIALTCFAAGAMAAGPITKIEAFLREDYKIKVNGELQQLSLPPLIYQDRTYLPLHEIAKHLGADIAWEGSTKTIYVNPRVPGMEPVGDDDALDDQQEDLEEIELIYATGLIGRYLGRDYPVLTTMGLDGITYYRLQDVERMGIDARPLVKVRETLTGALYVSETELKQAWKTPPQWSYPYPHPVIVTGENDSAKIEALLSYEPLELVPGPDEDSRPELRPIGGFAIVIDKLPEPENTYRMLYDARGELWQYDLRLKSHEKEVYENGQFRTVVEWTVNGVNNKKLSKERTNW